MMLAQTKGLFKNLKNRFVYNVSDIFIVVAKIFFFQSGDSLKQKLVFIDVMSTTV